MTALRKDLPALPPRMARLPLDSKGYPVPWFVAWIDGQPDFRVIGENKIATAYNKKLCWLCGEPMGSYKAFVIGPMCAINRTISEPPSHRDCAIFAATACPFLTRPRAKRREAGLAELDTREAAGNGIKRNPGVCLVWVTRSFEPFQASGRWLFSLGDPTEHLWFCEGRQATRAEVDQSIETGLPILAEEAAKEGLRAMAAFQAAVEAAQPLLPAV